MQIDRERAKDAFWAYVNGFDVQKDMIRLKVEHTFRVSELCEEIADSLGLSKEDRDLAWLIGLLHDLGRFEQQRRYGTFNDALSIDHARYGAELLSGEAASAVSIRDFVEADSEDGLIRTAVFYHSAYRIPENLDDRTAMFCNILRDADKIDILKVNVEFPLEEIYNVSTEVLYGEQVSPQVMLRSLKKTAVDHVVGHISLVFELVYPKSIEIVKKQGYLEKLLHFPSKNPVTRQQFAKIREKMK